MEDVRPVLMHVYALNALAKDVAAEVLTLVYNQAFLAALTGKVGKRSPEQAGADDKVIIFNHNILYCSIFVICFLILSMIRKGKSRKREQRRRR